MEYLLLTVNLALFHRMLTNMLVALVANWNLLLAMSMRNEQEEIKKSK
jgi:hypothetical protein